MKKCDLLDVQEITEKTIIHADALANLIRTVGVQGIVSETHQNECMSLLCFLTEILRENQLVISQGLTELYIVDDAVHGNSD